jgi:hypothetical protein
MKATLSGRVGLIDAVEWHPVAKVFHISTVSDCFFDFDKDKNCLEVCDANEDSNITYIHFHPENEDEARILLLDDIVKEDKIDGCSCYIAFLDFANQPFQSLLKRHE